MAGFRIKAQLHGASEVRARLQVLAAEAPRAVAKALYLVGADVRIEAMVRAPLKYGALRHSAYLTLPSFNDDGPSVEVGFGVVYAKYQHEGNFNHPRGGERYFLRNAVKEKATLSEVAARAKELLERGVGPLQPLAPATPQVLSRAQRRAAVRRTAARLKRRKKE